MRLISITFTSHVTFVLTRLTGAVKTVTAHLEFRDSQESLRGVTDGASEAVCAKAFP